MIEGQPLSVEPSLLKYFEEWRAEKERAEKERAKMERTLKGRGVTKGSEKRTLGILKSGERIGSSNEPVHVGVRFEYAAGVLE
jgi:hypothetical protein